MVRLMETEALVPLAEPPAATLGRLERVSDLRTYWPNEERDFTPWLARPENLKFLAEAISVSEIVLIQTERKVGPFEADIYAKEASSEDIVVVENQLGRTDHSHLGKLLVYSSGLGAGTVVWIAAEFTDEYRNVLDWLNETSVEGVNYFGLEIELWQIGTSPAAPKFNVVSQPNEWKKAVSDVASEDLTETKQLQLEFWREFVDYSREHGATYGLRKAPPRHWYDFAIGRGGFNGSLTLNTPADRIGCGLYIGHPAAKVAFAALERDREAIDAQLGAKLDWMKLPQRRASRIVQYRDDAGLSDRDRWPELHEWCRDRAETFRAVFGPRVQALELNEDDAVAEEDEIA